jgi:branched-subunit amino acid aminotransferase/4-amino-4-deoxychorismate lyase
MSQHPSGGLISVNGRILAPDQAYVSVLDAGFLLGDGLFESMRVTDGVPYLLDRHLQRLFAAAAEFEFANMPPTETVEEHVRQTLRAAALPDAYVRLTVTRGAGGVGLAPPSGPPTIVVAVLPARPVAPPDRGIDVALLWQQRERRAPAKSTSWQPAVLARRRVEQLGAEEGLYISGADLVLEGVASNVFVVTAELLLTPAECECLPGVTRARILEFARDHGLDTLETPLALETLRGAEEVFVTNAVQGLRPVRSIDGRSLAARGRGETFDLLRGLYEQDRIRALERAR